MRILGPTILTLTVLAASAETRPLDNYKSIVERNPFGLRPPPVQAPPNTNPPPVVVKKTEFYLTGISSVGFPRTPKTVYLVNKDTSKKDYAEKFYKLRLNEPQGDVALEEIDEKERRVKIKANGDEMWLSMKEHGMPSGAAGMAPQPAMAMPGMPGIPGMPPGQLAPPPGMAPVPLPGGGNPGISQPSYPVNAPNNPNRRIPRGGNALNNNAMNGAMNGVSFPAPTMSTLPPGSTMPAITFGQPTSDQVIQNNPGFPNNQGYPNNPPASEPQVDPARKLIETYINHEVDSKQKLLPPLPNFRP